MIYLEDSCIFIRVKIKWIFKEIGCKDEHWINVAHYKVHCSGSHGSTVCTRSSEISYLLEVRLQWSRVSALAFGTQVHGFKPGRSSRIFQGEKILSTPSFGRKVKPFFPCRIFAACKKNPKVYAWKSQLSVEITDHFSPK